MIVKIGDQYRFYSGPLDMESDERGIIDFEHDLEEACGRLLDHVLTGQGEQLHLAEFFRKNPQPEMGLEGDEAGDEDR